MSLVFEKYTRKALNEEPKQHWVDDKWRVDYLAFTNAKVKNNKPVLIVGGAFQNFNAFRSFVEKFLEDFPVVLVDLPSLGNNDQLAEDLSMEGMAGVLHRFVEDHKLEKVSPVGLSLGSIIVSTYAYQYPDECEKLIITGIAEKPRKSWRMLLSESLDVLNKDRLEEFGSAVILYLLNHNRLDETGVSETARNLFQRQLSSASENEKERYRLNAKRLLDVDCLPGFPECQTLVCTGEFDTFTLPYEHAEFADQCANATFSLIENADHLPQFERMKETVALFSAFLNEESLEGLEGIKTYSPGTYTNLERRGEPRYVPVNTKAILHSDSVCSDELSEEELLHDIKVKVRNINFFGCLIEFHQDVFHLIEHARDVTITLAHPDLQLDLLVFDQAAHTMRCLFRHSDMKQAMAFKELLEDWSCFRLPGRDQDDGLSGYAHIP
ncbi:MAG: alpha/beta hydrolase [Pseudomonadales bacterium]|nr:alpha/beta hydrolase [Pseudomonadales bacterium]